MLRIKPNADCILRWRRMRDARDPAVDQAHKPQLAARMPKPCDAFERLNIKLAIPGQREVNLLGKGRRTSPSYEQPIGMFPVITPLAFLRERKHVGADIADGAKNPSLLGRKWIGRKLLGEIAGREDHLRRHPVEPTPWSHRCEWP